MRALFEALAILAPVFFLYGGAMFLAWLIIGPIFEHYHKETT